MTNPDELAQTLLAVRDALALLGVPWAVGGSLASATYGQPRATNDIDVVLTLSESEAQRLPALLGDDFYVSVEAARDAARRRDSFNAIDQRCFLKVDFFVPPPGALGVGQLDRRRELELIGGVVVPVLAAEDIVLQKLRWYRLGGESSERQWKDIVEVLSQTEVDDAYLESVAEPAGLLALLERARTDAVS